MKPRQEIQRQPNGGWIIILGMDSLRISDGAATLAEVLASEGPVPSEYGEDALHIALSLQRR